MEYDAKVDQIVWECGIDVELKLTLSCRAPRPKIRSDFWSLNPIRVSASGHGYTRDHPPFLLVRYRPPSLES